MKIKVLFGIVVVATLGILSLCGCNRHETYIVTFDANGGTGTMRSQEFVEGEAQALRQNAFTRSGYSFSGWNTTQNGSGTAYSNGQTININSDMTLYAQWTNGSSQGGSGSGSGSGSGTGDDPGNGSGTQSTVSGSLNGHDYVDLGLPSGTLWATCNVGATTPEGYGDYFAWGETTPKETYTWSNYIYADYWEIPGYSHKTMTKYSYLIDTLTILEASDDAATANWGIGWRMPTRAEARELINNCTMFPLSPTDDPGFWFTGPNGNSIYLPKAGLKWSDILYEEYQCWYWTSTACGQYDHIYDDSAFALDIGMFGEDFIPAKVGSGGRAEGFPVRPVCVNR